MLGRLDSYLVTDVSEQPLRPSFKGKAVQEECWEQAYKWSRNVVKQPLNITEERRPLLDLLVITFHSVFSWFNSWSERRILVSNFRGLIEMLRH